VAIKSGYRIYYIRRRHACFARNNRSHRFWQSPLCMGRDFLVFGFPPLAMGISALPQKSGKTLSSSSRFSALL